MFTDIV